MRSATESHARPEAAAAFGRQISTCVPLKKVKTLLLASPSWRNGGPPPPSQWFIAPEAALPPALLTPWAVWVMTGCFCEKNFPFYLIKCGAWPTPRSTVCLAAFPFILLEKKITTWLIPACLPPPLQTPLLFIQRHLYFIDTIFRLLFIMLSVGGGGMLPRWQFWWRQTVSSLSRFMINL